MGFNVYLAIENKPISGFIILNVCLLVASLFSLLVVGSEIERIEKAEKE
jgi:hypothetical protein